MLENISNFFNLRKDSYYDLQIYAIVSTGPQKIGDIFMNIVRMRGMHAYVKHNAYSSMSARARTQSYL